MRCGLTVALTPRRSSSYRFRFGTVDWGSESVCIAAVSAGYISSLARPLSLTGGGCVIAPSFPGVVFCGCHDRSFFFLVLLVEELAAVYNNNVIPMRTNNITCRVTDLRALSSSSGSSCPTTTTSSDRHDTITPAQAQRRYAYDDDTARSTEIGYRELPSHN